MATAVTSWRTQVSDRLSRGIANATIDLAVVDAIREFCKETLIISVFCSDIDVVADTNTYDLKAAVNAAYDIVSIKSVRYKEATAAGAEGDDDDFFFLDPASEEILESISSGNWIYNEAPAPTIFYVDYDWNIKFTTIPTVASTDGIRAYVYAMPVIGSTNVDTFLYRDHRDAITFKALSILFERDSLVKDLAISKDYEKRFQAKCGDAKLIKYTGNANLSMSIKLPRFF